MRLLFKILRWALLVIIVLVLLIGGGGLLWLRGALPQTAGTITVQGIAAPIEILRDTDGVPHISAKTEVDAVFALGYVHAQDRLWQMEFQRRIGNGRLSEVLGQATLKTDTFLRTLGPARAAASALPGISPPIRKVLDAYVAGVNTYISSHHGRALPIEFTILGFEPEPWRPEDVLVWAKMMAWNLGDNWEKELLRAKLNEQLGTERTAQLMPAYTPDGPLILPSGSASADERQKTGGEAAGKGKHSSFVLRPSSEGAIACAAHPATCDGLLAIGREIKDTLGLGGTAIGSNNWVVGGAHSATGQPLLANDPHLGAQIPSIWYLAHLSGGQLDAIGATLPGVPGIVIGHNQRIAWGVTNTGPDVQDLYIEHINERGEVEHNGAWQPLKTVTEVIKVKGQPDVPIQVRITRHGPLISDAIEGAQQTLAFRWTALDDEDHTIEAFNGIARARDWEQFTKALRDYKAPMQNFVYADEDGNIGYYAPGALPLRAHGDGTLPVAGWTDEFDWTGYVPFEELPHAFNPPEGFIVTANNKVAPDSYPHLITTSFAAPYRAARIVELIRAKDKLSIDDMAAIQADVRSAQARELLPFLLKAKIADTRTRDAIAFLQEWDGSIAADSAQAAVYEAWYAQIPAHIFADELGEKLWDEYADEKDMLAMVVADLLKSNGTTWCDDVRTPQPEDCAAVLGGALFDGLNDMATRQGSEDFRAWRWDRVHMARFPHNPFDNVGALRPIFSRSIPNGGDGFTVDVGPIRRSELYSQYHVPSYRQIIDLVNWDASRFIHTGGQSGQLLSGGYSGMLERWQRVEYIPMRYEAEAINAAAAARLILQP
jgi:penicillin amidase